MGIAREDVRSNKTRKREREREGVRRRGEKGEIKGVTGGGRGGKNKRRRRESEKAVK